MTSDNGSKAWASSSHSTLAQNIAHGYELGWSFTPLNGKRPKLKAWQDRPREALEEAVSNSK